MISPGSGRGFVDPSKDLYSHDCFHGTIDFYTKIIKIAGEMDGVTGLKYILNTEYMGTFQPERIRWDLDKCGWGIWDTHFVIQKFSNENVDEIVQKEWV